MEVSNQIHVRGAIGSVFLAWFITHMLVTFLSSIIYVLFVSSMAVFIFMIKTNREGVSEAVTRWIMAAVVALVDVAARDRKRAFDEELRAATKTRTTSPPPEKEPVCTWTATRMYSPTPEKESVSEKEPMFT